MPCTIPLILEARIIGCMDIFHVFQMVGATHGTPKGFRPDQASGSQQLPPPPPNLVEVMA
jgi:hypothetical protein